MHRVLITGAGKIGSLIAMMLAESGDYQVHIADVNLQGQDLKRVLDHYARCKTQCVKAHLLDVNDEKQWKTQLAEYPVDAVISSLPYFANTVVAKMAQKFGLHYFDLTEDTSVTRAVKDIASNAKTAFVPQCGLAPGFVSIAANSLMRDFEELDAVKLRVGALPQHTTNALHYALTWSTDGLINEYGNPCYAIKNKEPVIQSPLDELENILIDGMHYEAFNTSGGLGSLGDLYAGHVNTMNYKTLRYPGHCEKIRVLMNDLKLNQDRATLKRILENAIPKTYQDVVVVYVSVTGLRHGTFVEENYAQKIYPKSIADVKWSAIQIATASGICTVVDLVLSRADSFHGLVYQENFELKQFLENRFGQYYQ